jgi:tRNA-specific 2-thiouridylase
MKIAVLVSGGVDSSVVLGMLAREGKHELTAYYLKIWLEDELHFLGQCPWEEDLKYVRAVCDQFGVNLKVVSLQREYNELVVQYTISELKLGRTPSPDIFCNQRVKFGAFLKHIDQSYDRIATGHYASTIELDGVTYLKQGVDPIKDQTYFLSHLSQQQLRRCLFPLGAFLKSEVRALANEMNLATQHRPDSQGICFLGKIKFNEFVKFHLGTMSGPICEWETGKKLGTHEGYWFHTYGQRKGLRLHGGPWFVVDKNISTNTVFVTHKEALVERARSEFFIDGFNLLSGELGYDNMKVKVRHGPHKIAATVCPTFEKFANETYLRVTIDQPDSGLANGQIAVLYKDDICVGGGMIRLSALEGMSAIGANESRIPSANAITSFTCSTK